MRLTIDRGYTALLPLIELRRLIQTNAGAPGLIGDLMVDVKINVDLLHMSLGVAVQINSRKGKTTEIGDGRAASTLSMPKGRVLCACAIEEGILPHSQRLCPFADGVELHPLVAVVRRWRGQAHPRAYRAYPPDETDHRSADILSLSRCAHFAGEGQHVRHRQQSHADEFVACRPVDGQGCLCRLLCEQGLVPKGRYLQWHTRWVPKMTLKKGRALWRLPLIFIKVTSWINSKCRIYTTFKLWHKGTATRLGAKLWQCSLESVW